MKKIYLLFVAATLAACSAESVENEMISLDAAVTGKKVKALEADYLSYPETACTGEEALFTYHFEGKESGKTNLKLDLWGDDPETAEEVVDWYPIDQQKIEGGGPVYFSYVFDAAGSYNLRYQIGGGQPTYFSVLVENCGCDESFTYVDNGDMTYTFTYVPEEDMIDAELVFTFAQGTSVSGLESWFNNGKAQTWHLKETLNECQTYSWTVALDANCPGKTGENNVWTDFKVNEVSKKADPEDKFVQACN